MYLQFVCYLKTIAAIKPPNPQNIYRTQLEYYLNLSPDCSVRILKCNNIAVFAPNPIINCPIITNKSYLQNAASTAPVVPKSH